MTVYIAFTFNLQEAADLFGGMFMEDMFIDMLKRGAAIKDGLEQLSLSMLSTLHKIEEEDKSNSTFHAVWTSPAMAPIAHILRIYKVLPRCLCHLLCIDLPEHFPPTTDEDVYAPSNYDGQELFERSLRRVLKDPDLFWHGEINDLIKKGADTALSKLKVSEIQELLAKDSLSFQQMHRATELLGEIKNCVRSQKLGTLMSQFAAAWPFRIGDRRFIVLLVSSTVLVWFRDKVVVSEAQALSLASSAIDGTVDGLNSSHADILRAALSSASAMPKVEAAQKRLHAYMQSHVVDLAKNDLLRMMEPSDPEARIDYAKIRLCMEKCGEGPLEANKKVESCMRAIILRLVKQAGYDWI